MALSISKPPTETVPLPSGIEVEIRGLTRAEALQINTFNQDVTRIEIHCIRHACGISESEAIEWWTASRNDDVDALVGHISRLSGLNEQTGKADAGDSPSAKSTLSTTS